MKIALVSSDGRCGIAEHSNLLVQSVQQADPGIEFLRDAAWLNPDVYGPWAFDAAVTKQPPDVLHLNHHRGLHSRWTPDVVQKLRDDSKVVITLHDTYETQPDSLPWDLLDVCDAMIVHEPCDLQQEYAPTLNRHRAKVHYWRQGVPEPSTRLSFYGNHTNPHTGSRPIVGTCGFAFPWKGFELLCDAATSVGWGVSIFSHNATSEQANDWERRNPWVYLDRQYYSTPEMIANLAACDATAFLYQCANSGTSGAIRLGIAAGKPLLATEGCRQFRDLAEMEEPGSADPSQAILWTALDPTRIAWTLANLTPVRFEPRIVALRERDSWRHLGKRYASLYRSLV